MSGKGLGAEDVVLLAGELESMEGLTELDMRHAVLGKEGAAAVVAALAGCGLLARLTISGEDGKETGWIEKEACAGSSLEVGAIVQYEGRPCRVTRVDSDGELRVRACGAVVTMEAGMTELDVSGKGLGAAGAAVVAGFLPRCTALVSANLLCNGIGTEQAAVLVAVVKEHGTLESVCGLRGSDTVVDMIGKGMGAEDVVLLAGELESMEGLTELDLRHTLLGKEGAAAVVVALAGCGLLAKLTISGEDGKETGWIEKEACAGSSLEVGAIVQYEGRPCRVTRVFSDGDIKVRACGAVVTMEAGMTELDVSGKGLGAAAVAVVAGFLPGCTLVD
jgi:sorbitol-specific phosphotransferase system component IIA